MTKTNKRIFFKTVIISGVFQICVITVICLVMAVENAMNEGLYGDNIYFEILNFVKDMLK